MPTTDEMIFMGLLVLASIGAGKIGVLGDYLGMLGRRLSGRRGHNA